MTVHLLFQVGKQRIRVHKAILAARSTTFHALLQSDGKLKQLEITDAGVDAVKAMLRYVYTGRVDADTPVEMVGDILHLAGKYDLPGLGDRVSKGAVSVENFTEFLLLAESSGREELKEVVCLKGGAGARIGNCCTRV